MAVIPPKAPQTLRTYCHTHGGDIHNNHTSATCAQPGVNHQHAATRFNTMGGNNKGLLKTILPGAIGQRAPAAQPNPQPTNHTPTYAMPFGNNGPRFPTVPGSWGFGPHAAAYQHASNIPPPQPGTSMMANTMEFNNWVNYLGTMPAPPAYGQPNPGQSFYQNHFLWSGAVNGIHKLITDLLQHCPTPTPKYAFASAALLRTVNIDMDAMGAWAILDSGLSRHFLTTAAPMTNMHSTSKPIVAQLPNGKRVHSMNMCTLNIPALPTSAQHVHIIPGLASHSLISVVTLCNAGCNVIFTKIECTILYHGKLILCGSKCTRTGLWMIPLCPTLPESPQTTTKPACFPLSLQPMWMLPLLWVNMHATYTRLCALFR